MTDTRLISNIDISKYHNIIISDHSPVGINLKLSLPKQTYSWRFNPTLLADPTFVNLINDQISLFLENNDNGEVNDSTLWETFKVYIRGQVISFEAKKNKVKYGRLKEIERKLEYQDYKKSQLQSDYNNILKLQYEYNSLLGEQVGNMLLKLKQKHFELGEKPHKLLPRQLKGEQSKRAIYKVKSKTGSLVTELLDINERFREFYSDIYSSKTTATLENFDNFFNSLSLPQLDASSKDHLDLPITVLEIQEAIKAFPGGKAPGPDGYGPEFYKAFGHNLAPLLLRMIKERQR